MRVTKTELNHIEECIKFFFIRKKQEISNIENRLILKLFSSHETEIQGKTFKSKYVRDMLDTYDENVEASSIFCVSDEILENERTRNKEAKEEIKKLNSLMSSADSETIKKYNTQIKMYYYLRGTFNIKN